MKKEHQKLIDAIEQEVGKKMLTPRDFEWLSAKVEARTKEHLSEPTLMRLWGYRPSVGTRQSTLGILVRFLGYADYVTFGQWKTADEGKEVQSDEVIARHLRTKELEAGTRLVLTWYPDRRCMVELCDDGFFKVLEAENTKLCVGDRFECSLIVDGEPLYMSQLVHEERGAMVYVAGKVGGIHFSFLPSDEE